jgi:flagellar hook-associated protein 1 FlgK
MSTGFFNSGISGLNAARLGLMTTEHNIANASTPGFNRQRTIQATNWASLTGSGYVGQGVQVSTIERMYDRFLSGQVNQAQTALSELDAYSAQITQVDNMLADPSAGLSPALQDFFKGVQAVAANPSQLPARQSMISTAQSLASRYQAMAGQLSEISSSVNGQISSAVASVNLYAQQIGTLNEQIIVAQAGTSQPANDLLDQRDQLVSELNKLVKVSTISDSEGRLSVFMGSGQQLVVGTQVRTLTATASEADSSKIAVGLQTSGGVQELPDSLISGGSLGGLLKFRNESLDRVINDLGRSAASMALTFNAQNALGQDLLGQSTGVGTFQDDFFNISQPSVSANSKNPVGSPTVTASFTAPSYSGNFYTDLTSSDYQLSEAGGTVTLTRLSDSKQWAGADVTAINTALAVEPQGFTLASSAALTSGSSYLIKPTHDLASAISVNATVAADARLVAAAAPVRTLAGTGNTGGARISAGSVATGYPSAVAGAPITLTYDSTSVPPSLSGFPVGVAVSVSSGGTTTSYAAPVASINYASGATITLEGSSPPAGFSFVVSGSPNNGDQFSILKNAAGVADGRNVLALGQLQTQNTLSGKTASYQGAYAQLVNDVGNKTRAAQIKGDAQQALLAQSQSSRDSLSGVNLDEEAANLIKYQQAYQAASKVIEIGSKLFDTLLSLGR